MDYLVVLYDNNGVKTYNFRAMSSEAAFGNLADLNQSPDLYPFKNAACYCNDKSVWRVTKD